MKIDPPEVFIRLCHEYYSLEPERVIDALLFSFCESPPRELVLVEHAAVREELGGQAETLVLDQWPSRRVRAERASK